MRAASLSLWCAAKWATKAVLWVRIGSFAHNRAPAYSLGGQESPPLLPASQRPIDIVPTHLQQGRLLHRRRPLRRQGYRR